MADTGTIASLATAGGTLVLALATFASTRSANRAARVSEQALKVGLRPVLFNARPQDPPQKVGYGDDHWLVLRDGLAAVQEREGTCISRFHCATSPPGWRCCTAGTCGRIGRRRRIRRRRSDFRTHTRDLYVPAGDVSFWQAALRDHDDPLHEPLRDAISARTPLSVDLLYGDHEGGQRTITRFYIYAAHARRRRAVVAVDRAPPRATGTWTAQTLDRPGVVCYFFLSIAMVIPSFKIRTLSHASLALTRPPRPATIKRYGQLRPPVGARYRVSASGG